jgi:RNA polymerase sigma-70 factor (ECF subfamily)
VAILSPLHASVTNRPATGSFKDSLPETTSFHDQFTAVFDATFARLFRYLDRLSSDPDLAADLAQEAFVRLYRRGALPDTPEAWLISVAMNLFRNARATSGRRRRLLTVARGASAHADPPPTPEQSLASKEIRSRVRQTIDRMPERERRLLLLQAEGFSYREIAVGLGLHEASIGTLLARARDQFRELYGDADAY